MYMLIYTPQSYVLSVARHTYTYVRNVAIQLLKNSSLVSNISTMHKQGHSPMKNELWENTLVKFFQHLKGGGHGQNF